MFASSSRALVIECARDEHRCVLRLIGALDLDAAPRLRAVLEEQIGTHQKIRLDLSRLTFIDSAGVRAIVDAHGGCARAGGELTATAAAPQVQRVLQRVLEITGLERVGPFERGVGAGPPSAICS